MRFGIVGTNFISDSFAEACIAAGHRPAAVYSRAKETGEVFAERHGIENVFTSYTDMLDSGLIDAVYVASPTMCHKHHTIEAIKRGIPSLTEKMITATLDEFIDLKDALASHSGVLVEAMRIDFDDMIDILKRELPKIGEIRSASFEYRQYSRRYDKFKEGVVLNAFEPKMKNSALADIGIYPLHAAISLFGMPSDVESESKFLHNGFESEGRIKLSYDRFFAEVIYSKTVEGANVSKIVGELGEITVDKINEPKTVTLTLADGTTEVFRADEKKSNMVREISEFARIAMGDKKRGDDLLSVTEKTMSCVDIIYKQNEIEKFF